MARLMGALLAAVLLTGCSDAPPTTAPVFTPAVAAVAPSPSPMPVPTPDAPMPTPKPVVTPKPKPTLRPAVLTAGKLTYTASGCWSSNYLDGDGHSISGTMVNFGITLKNAGQVASDTTWFAIESSDWSSTTPLSFHGNFTPSDFRSNERLIAIAGPKIGAGKSRTFTWSVLFQSPFDVHYSVDVASGDFGTFFLADLMAAIAQESVQHWKLWTSTEVCY
jgi:hypothetical protein